MFEMFLGMQNEPALMYNVVAFVIGLCIHVGKKCYMEDVSLRDYILEHKLNTTMSMTSLIGAFYYLQVSYAAAPLMIYFLGGYCIDSLLNKAPKTKPTV